MSEGPVPMLSCNKCVYHSVARDLRRCIRSAQNVVLSQSNTTFVLWKIIDLPGDRTPDWCPLIENGEET